MEKYRRRTGQRLTYEELSRLTGLSKGTLEALGSRANYNTTLSTVDILCSKLGCDLADLLEYTPPGTVTEDA